MNRPISTLNLPNYIITELEMRGFHYCNEVEANLTTIRNKIPILDWSSVTAAPPERTALDLYNEELAWKPIKIPIPELELILNDQINPGCITELAGFPGTGKTQICLHLAVGVNGEAVFVHTNNNLNPERLREVVGKGVSHSDATLEKLLCIEAADPLELVATVEFLETWLRDHAIRLVIIDSIAWVLRQQPFMERTGYIYTVFQKLRTLANTHGFAVVVTNDLTTRLDGSDTYHTASFGDSFHHCVNNQMLLTREGGSFSAKVLKSVRGVPPDSVLFSFV